jgi:hypothetical protein
MMFAPQTASECPHQFRDGASSARPQGYSCGSGDCGRCSAPAAPGPDLRGTPGFAHHGRRAIMPRPVLELAHERDGERPSLACGDRGALGSFIRRSVCMCRRLPALGCRGGVRATRCVRVVRGRVRAWRSSAGAGGVGPPKGLRRLFPPCEFQSGIFFRGTFRNILLARPGMPMLTLFGGQIRWGDFTSSRGTNMVR